MSTTGTRTVGRSVVGWVAIAVAFANFGIHVALTPMHLDEMPYIGVLFAVGSVLLAAVMVGLACNRNSLRTLAWAGGSVVCAAEFILFVISRTSGLPGGYHESWSGSTEDAFGIVSLVAEAVFIACAVVSLAATAVSARRSGRGHVVCVSINSSNCESSDLR